MKKYFVLLFLFIFISSEALYAKDNEAISLKQALEMPEEERGELIQTLADSLNCPTSLLRYPTMRPHSHFRADLIKKSKYYYTQETNLDHKASFILNVNDIDILYPENPLRVSLGTTLNMNNITELMIALSQTTNSDILLKAIKEANINIQNGAILRNAIIRHATFDNRNNYNSWSLERVNKLNMIRALIAAGADVNMKEKNTPRSQTLLHNMILTGGAFFLRRAVDIEALEMLINAGADVNAIMKYGYTPLHLLTMSMSVSSVNYLEAIRILIEAGADVNAKDNYGNTPLHLLVANPFRFRFNYSLEAIRILIEAGADVNAKNKLNETPLDSIEIEKDPLELEAAILLIQAGAVNATNDSPLSFAVRHSNVEMLKALIEAGANVNDPNYPLLHIAIRQGNIEVVRILIAAGANVNDPNYPLLHIAVRQRNKEVVKALIEAKADVNAQVDSGDTPMHIAIREGDTEIEAELIAANADLDIKNKEGKTARQLIFEREQQANE